MTPSALDTVREAGTDAPGASGQFAPGLPDLAAAEQAATASGS